METREEPCPAVLRLFGREPSVEDWRCVGRWAYAAAWLSTDQATARDLATARLSMAAKAATSAAMAAGRGDADRFTLVSALARLPEAIESGQGAFAPATDRSIEETATQLVRDGAALRGLTQRERAAFAPRFELERFEAGLRELGPDRQIWLREAAADLDEALLTARGACPALRTLRQFLRATLAVDAHEAATTEPSVVGGEGPLTELGAWLSADLALTARRSVAYAAAWASAARSCGDALSRTLSGLTSGAMMANGVGDALANDPWALVLALAMTSEAEHASAVLDCGTQAQGAARARAGTEVAAWASQALRVDDLERRLGIAVLAPHEDREGHREFAAGAPDLFSAWHATRTAEESRLALRQAMERSLAHETGRRREAVLRAKSALEAVRRAYEATLEAARTKQDAVETPSVSTAEEDQGAQRGCIFGFGAGCSVMATYAVVSVFVGTDGVIGKAAPLVVGVAALPMIAAITVQIAYALRRSARSAEVARRRNSAQADFERARQEADRTHGAALTQGRMSLEEAESGLALFEGQSAPDLRLAA